MSNSEQLSPTVFRFNKYRFFVESESNGGTYYTVQWSRDKERFYCSCMDSICRTKECKHSTEIRNIYAKRHSN